VACPIFPREAEMLGLSSWKVASEQLRDSPRHTLPENFIRENFKKNYFPSNYNDAKCLKTFVKVCLYRFGRVQAQVMIIAEIQCPMDYKTMDF
jgi:hypothetical protein